MIRWCNYDFRVDSETQILEDKRQTQQSDYKQMLLLIRLACTFKTMNDIFTPIGDSRRTFSSIYMYTSQSVFKHCRDRVIYKLDEHRVIRASYSIYCSTPPGSNLDNTISATCSINQLLVTKLVRINGVAL